MTEPGKHPPQTPATADIVSVARELLLRHRRATPSQSPGKRLRYTCPAPDRYPFQWFWDSCFHAIALSCIDAEAAWDELRSLVHGQGVDGSITHVRFWRKRLLFNPALYWCWLQSSGIGVPDRSALIQPPVLAQAVEHVWRRTGNIAALRSLLPAVDRYYCWLWHTRRHSITGLLAIVAPWESGMDHRPAYDAALGLPYPASPRQLIVETRTLDIVNRARDYQLPRLFAWPRFLVADVLVNAVYVDGLRALVRLHAEAGIPLSTITTVLERADEIERAMLAHLRDADGRFYDLDLRRGQLLRVKTVAGLMPLLLDGLSTEGAEPLLRDLRDERRFAAPFAVPSVAMDEPAFVGEEQHWRAGPLIWRGPTWINTNWLLVQALSRRRLAADAGRIRRSSVRLVQQAGFREYYNPITGTGYGPRSFAWSTLVLDMLQPDTGRQGASAMSTAGGS